MKLIHTLLFLTGAIPTFGFVHATSPFGTTGTTTALSSSSSSAAKDNISSETVDGSESLQVTAPLKYVGAYACLALRFPNLATANQRQQGKAGVSLDFVLATATNANTIAQPIVSALELSSVGTAMPTIGGGPGSATTATYLLGDTQLDGQVPIFMTDLTASTLPVSNPSTAGTLSMAFLQAFDGIDFGWGIVNPASGQVTRSPTITFVGGSRMPSRLVAGRTRVPLLRLSTTQSPLVKITVNGVPMTALLDTGSPISILSTEAAQRASVTPKAQPNAMLGEKLTVAGENGRPLDLIQSADPASVQIPGQNAGESVDFGTSDWYVGNVPGLTALKTMMTSSLSNSAGVNQEDIPTAVLGLNILMRRPSMLLQPKVNQLWFE